ncbi:MAG: dihydrofolate synthase/folylpolyglutamate synthase, partial [Alphaproteobacteria bacterium]
MAALGHPERKSPPVIHVAGTNGKGSVVAHLRAMFEAAGLKAHVYTSPHLVRFHERIRVAGRLISERALDDALRTCEAANRGHPITFFEITTAAAFLTFARARADVTLLEVGLGGRLDATNVVTPRVSVITPVARDHQQFLGTTLSDITYEKAGIVKPGVPCVTGPQHAHAATVIEARAKKLGAPLIRFGQEFKGRIGADGA